MIEQHTATPWQQDEDWIVSGDGNPVAAAHMNAEANAAFIVRACNAHDDLVRALRHAVEAFEADNDKSWYVAEARAALAKAGA